MVVENGGGNSQNIVPPAGKPPTGKPEPKPLWMPMKGKQPKGPKASKQSTLKPMKEYQHKKGSSLRKASKAGKVIFTIKEKLQILQVWNETKNGTGRKSSVAKRFDVDQTTIRRWKKKEAQMKEALEVLGRGEKKTLHKDHLQRISHVLGLFYETNERMPRDLKLPLTGMYMYHCFSIPSLSYYYNISFTKIIFLIMYYLRSCVECPGNENKEANSSSPCTE